MKKLALLSVVAVASLSAYAERKEPVGKELLSVLDSEQTTEEKKEALQALLNKQAIHFPEQGDALIQLIALQPTDIRPYTVAGCYAAVLIADNKCVPTYDLSQRTISPLQQLLKDLETPRPGSEYFRVR